MLTPFALAGACPTGRGFFLVSDKPDRPDANVNNQSCIAVSFLVIYILRQKNICECSTILVKGADKWKSW